MSETPPSDPTPPPVPSPPAVPAADANGQLIVSLAIVVVMGMIAVGLIVAGCISGKWEVLTGGIGAAIGALATALNAPSGIGNVLRAGKGDVQP